MYERRKENAKNSLRGFALTNYEEMQWITSPIFQLVIGQSSLVIRHHCIVIRVGPSRWTNDQSTNVHPTTAKKSDLRIFAGWIRNRPQQLCQVQI